MSHVLLGRCWHLVIVFANVAALPLVSAGEFDCLVREGLRRAAALLGDVSGQLSDPAVAPWRGGWQRPRGLAGSP